MAMPDPRTAPAAASDAPVRVDRTASTRHLQRQARGAAQAPWLHAEVARRMAERLDFIKAQPQCIVDWWARQGASGELLLVSGGDDRLAPLGDARGVSARGEGDGRHGRGGDGRGDTN